MRKYTGKHPNEIWKGNLIAGRWLVKTRNGAQYFLDGVECPIGDIMDFKFQRAHPQTFQQQGCAFYRMIDGWAIEFAYYRMRSWIEEQRREVRQAFIDDMARQNIVCRFQEAP